MLKKNKKIIVTGGAGFVGTNLIKLLLNKTKYKIISLDNYTSGSKKNHIKNKRIKYIFAHTKDINKTLVKIKSRIDACVRLREIFDEVPHERNTFFIHHGAAPLMAILEQSQNARSSPEASNVVLAALRLVNTIVRDNQKLQEKLSSEKQVK